jgi:hypothetical protein
VHVQIVLHDYGQQPAGTAHQSPVIFESGSTGQAYLVMTTLVVDAGPGEPMGATLAKKVLEEIHCVTA